MSSESLRTVRDRFSEFIDRVQSHHERVIVTKNGTPAAVLISPEDLESLEEGTHFSGIEFYIPYLYSHPGTLLDYMPTQGTLIVDDMVELADAAGEDAEEEDPEDDAGGEGGDPQDRRHHRRSQPLAAVGAFAIAHGLVDAARVPENGVAEVRIWQVNIGKTIVNHVPIVNGEVQETGDFELDGVTFPAAEVPVDFVDPADEEGGSMFPTGQLVDDLEVPGVGTFRATMINAGIPTIFLDAGEIGYTGTELQDDINNDEAALARFETIRAWGAVRMGLIDNVAEAASRQHTPKVAFVAEPASYTASSGKEVNAADIDLLVRALSMGKLHHAMMGTAAVAIGTAAAIPGTLVNLAAGGGERDSVRFGHPSGTLRVGAQAREENGEWRVLKASMSRSARVLMEGWVRVPGDAV